MHSAVASVKPTSALDHETDHRHHRCRHLLLGAIPRPERRYSYPQVHLHPRVPMTYDEMLQQRLKALLEVIEPGVTSDLLITEYQRIHEEVTRIQEEQEWK